MSNNKFQGLMLTNREDPIKAGLFFLILSSFFSNVSAQNLRSLSGNETCTSCPDGSQCCPPEDLCLRVDSEYGPYYNCSKPVNETEKYILFVIAGVAALIFCCGCIFAPCSNKKIEQLYKCCKTLFPQSKPPEINNNIRNSLLDNNAY